MLGYDGGTIYQPSAPNMIGTEVVDPPIFTGGSCPAGKKCRWSDALLAQYSNGISAVRRVAATAGYQQMTITDTVHLWSAYGFGYPAEQITGRTSGTSLGSTGYGQLPMCANYYPDSVAYKNSGVTIPSNLVLLCQNAGSYARGGGDSGAPVYVCDISLGYLWCLAAGVHHAGNATGGIYSPISSVQNDLGSMPIYPSTWMGN